MNPVVLGKFLSLFELVTNAAMDVKHVIAAMEKDTTFAQRLNDAVDGLGNILMETGIGAKSGTSTAAPSNPAGGAAPVSHDTQGGG